MKSFLILLFTLISFIGVTQCNNYQVYESFTGALPTQGGTWDQSSIGYSTASVRTGNNNLSFNGQGDFIRTPIISNPSVVTFWIRRSGTSATHNFVVETSTDNTNWTTRNTYSANPTATYNKRTIDLTSLNLVNVYIRIRDTRSSGLNVWYLDDFGVTSSNSNSNTIIPFESNCSQTLTSSLTYTITDRGGTTDNYANSLDQTVTLTPSDNTKKLQLNFSSFNIEAVYDFLYVYDGPNTSSPLLATLNGTSLPSSITAENATGQLTLRFTSDIGGIRVGFQATVTSITLPTPSCISSPTSPTDVLTNQSLTSTLSWPAATYATSYDVYFGTTLPGTPTTNTSSTTYNPGTLLAGTTYFWKIVPKNTIGEPTGCSTWSFTTLTRPINDNPSGAITLTIGTTVSYSTYTNLYSTNTTTESTPSCASYTGEDVWFKLTVPQYINSLDFDTQTGVITDGGIAVYRGTPGSLVEIQCDDDSSPNGLMSFISRGDFFEYETIYIRVWEYGGEITGTFGISVTTPQPLPVELGKFEGIVYTMFNLVNWTTESENNSSHFDLESSNDGNNWKTITTKSAAGNSNEQIRYSYIDNDLSEVVYYRLQQFDIDGKSETFGPIVITRDVTDKKIIGYINLLGQKVDPKYTTGVIIEIYDDGTMIKKIK